MKKQTKEIIAFLLIGFVLLVGVIQFRHMRDNKDIDLKGKYIGEAMGRNGKVSAALSIENKRIVDIEILKNDESQMAQRAFDYMAENIVKNNSLNVDDVAGATKSSKDLKVAIADAMNKSGIILASSVKVQPDKKDDVNTDIVVVGGGGAGLTAAIEGKEKGADVILVEKLPILGGNTKFATGGLNAAQTKFQKEKGIEDSTEKFIEDTLKGGKNINNKELVKVLAEKSSEMVEWLSDRGMDLSDVGRLGGASIDRAHRPKGGLAVGGKLFDSLEKAARNDGVDIRVATEAVKVLYDGTKVNGIKVKTMDGNSYNIYAKAVIIATGGFGANQDMIVEYKKELKGFGTTNSPGATGDAIHMLKDLNIALVDMDQIQIHPTVVWDDNHLITEAVRGNGAILVNKSGKRFVNELSTRDVVSQAELAQENHEVYLIFDEKVRKSLKAVEQYYKEGLITEGKSLKELADAMEINNKELQKTVKEYNEYVELGNDPDFDRKSMKFKLEKSNFYGVKVAPAVHYTMGGLKINTKAEVIDHFGKVVKGLYAAGEVTGGIHGGNRLGGNSLTDISVFGKIAGESAYGVCK
ncbi:flavocytochrome c [Lutibacter sp. B2]|nr:flavocytochrome c [Lutibacter sp. B2]